MNKISKIQKDENVFHKTVLAVLIITIIIYPSFKYIFKQQGDGMISEASGGGLYTPITFFWLIGKFIVIILLLLLFYLKSKFEKSYNFPLLLSYFFVLIFILLDIVSIFSFQQDRIIAEFQYFFLFFLLFPMVFVKKNHLKFIEYSYENMCMLITYFFIISGWIVFLNYYYYDVYPFHSHGKGSIIRFGGLWDDPNIFPICNIFIFFFLINKKKYLLSVLIFFNIVIGLSFTAYLVFFISIYYWILKSKSKKILRYFLVVLIPCLLIVVFLLNYDLFMLVFEQKSESVEMHANTDFTFYFLPLQQPFHYHETWLLSFNINYFPFSVIPTFFLVLFYYNCLFRKEVSYMHFFYVIFFSTSLFLPFIYVFPINFIAMLFFILYFKGIRF